MISSCFEYVSHWSARTLRRSACKTRHIDWAVQLYPVPLPPKGGDGVTQVIAHLQAHLVVHLARAAARNPIGASVRRIESDDCSTGSMISNFSDAEYLMKRPSHPRERFF
jgi:hypothetical protein